MGSDAVSFFSTPQLLFVYLWESRVCECLPLLLLYCDDSPADVFEICMERKKILSLFYSPIFRLPKNEGNERRRQQQRQQQRRRRRPKPLSGKTGSLQEQPLQKVQHSPKLIRRLTIFQNI